jgi:hypothetical protein
VSAAFAKELVMIRTMPLTLAAVALLCLSAVGLYDGHAQQPAPIQLDQSLLDRWIVAMPQVIKLGKSGTPQTDDALRPHLNRICAEAGFDSYDQCGETIGYVGMIVSACDRKSGTFRDPIVMMRRQIRRIEANAKLSPDDKEKATAELKHIVARFPNNLPEAHIGLVTANRDRIFAVLATVE